MKTLYKISVRIVVIGFFIWLAETVYFLIAYGWHIYPINDTEQLWDDISSYIMRIGLLGWFWCACRIIHLYYTRFLK